jgi:hypothetical protein
MAIPPPGFLDSNWVRDAFLREYTYKTELFTDMFCKRGPTEASIKADVAKLKSVSAAARVWITDRRMAIASVGPWKDTLVFRRKGGGYPAIIMKSRQEGVTYSMQLRAAD